MFVQLGGVIAANIYRADDKPKYHRGNSQLIAINILSISLFFIAKGYYIVKNRSRAKKWGTMTIEVCYSQTGHEAPVEHDVEENDLKNAIC